MKPRWNAKRTGVRSGLEDRVRKDLDARGIKYGYESIKLKYVKEQCNGCGRISKFGIYTPDFIIERSSRIRLVVECKGLFSSADREKHKRVKRDNHTEDIRFVFQRDNPIRKGSKTRYSDWAIKHGFQYHIGETIPQEWIDE